MNTLILKLKVFKLSLKPLLGLFSADNLLVESLNGLLSLSQSTSQLLLAALKLINPAKAFSLKLGLPELNLSLSLGKSLQGIRFLLRLKIFILNKCHLKITSVFMFLNLLRRDALSLASASPRRLVSSSWVVREILALPRAAMAFSVSSICLWRSRFST